jgi:kynurenine formamidase
MKASLKWFCAPRCLLLLTTLALGWSATGQEKPQAMQLRNKQDFERALAELSNWGRWGTNDQLGALNLVTPAKRKQALGLVRTGISVSLARDAEKEKAIDNGSPFFHSMDRTGTNNPGFSCADTYKVSYHGMAHTHIDSLCHMFYRGKMYNDFPQSEVTSEGAGKLGIQNLKQGILTRGILIDIPLLKNVAYLEPGTAIYPEDLDAWEKKSGIRVGSGDVVLIRTGRWARRAAVGPWGGKFAGLHGSCARWLKQRDVAVVGSDAASDVLPSGVEDVAMPIHQLCLIAMGTWILDNCDLEALSKSAKQQQRWEFLLVVAPLAVPGGTGSPVNPIATF